MGSRHASFRLPVAQCCPSQFRAPALHALSNVSVVLMFTIAFWPRSNARAHRTDAASLTLEILAFVLLGVAAWLGGELVDRLGIGIDDGAHPNPPSSLYVEHVPSARS